VVTSAGNRRSGRRSSPTWSVPPPSWWAGWPIRRHPGRWRRRPRA